MKNTDTSTGDSEPLCLSRQRWLKLKKLMILKTKTKMKMKLKKIPYKALSRSLQIGLLKGWHILTLNPYDSFLIPRSTIAVSLERENVTIACLSRFASRFTVKKENGYPFVDEAYPSAHNVLSALESFIQSSGLSPQPVTLALPKAWVVTRKWQLPRSIEAEMAMAITHEMDVITPFSSDEVYFDYQILSRDENTIHFLVAAIRKDKIQPYLDLLKESKFPVTRITVNIAAFGTACAY